MNLTQLSYNLAPSTNLSSTTHLPKQPPTTSMYHIATVHFTTCGHGEENFVLCEWNPTAQIVSEYCGWYRHEGLNDPGTRQTCLKDAKKTKTGNEKEAIQKIANERVRESGATMATRRREMSPLKTHKSTAI